MGLLFVVLRHLRAAIVRAASEWDKCPALDLDGQPISDEQEIHAPLSRHVKPALPERLAIVRQHGAALDGEQVFQLGLCAGSFR